MGEDLVRSDGGKLFFFQIPESSAACGDIEGFDVFFGNVKLLCLVEKLCQSDMLAVDRIDLALGTSEGLFQKGGADDDGFLVGKEEISSFLYGLQSRSEAGVAHQGVEDIGLFESLDKKDIAVLAGKHLIGRMPFLKSLALSASRIAT